MYHLVNIFLIFIISISMQQVFGKPIKSAHLNCDSFLSKSTPLPKGSKVLGTIDALKLPLLNAGIVLGKPIDITSQVFNEEILDEWKILKDGSEQTIAQYDQGHQDLMLRCTYKSSTSGRDSSNTTLLVPLPDKPVSCRIVRKSDQALSATCTIK